MHNPPKWTQQVLFIACAYTYYSYMYAHIYVAIIKIKDYKFWVGGDMSGN